MVGGGVRVSSQLCLWHFGACGHVGGWGRARASRDAATWVLGPPTHGFGVGAPGRGFARSEKQCFPFTGIGPAAESNPATIRIKYGINPGISGICPIPAAESKVGYIPLFWRATVAWSRGARAPLAKRGRPPWPGRRLGARAHEKPKTGV